jgi:DNA invertase Pin-like site-specific DNA recombinase
MPGKSDQVRQARELLARERADVLAALAAAREDGRRLADAQKAWRDDAANLIARGDAAGLSVTEMAKALGLSRQWTTHIRKELERRKQVARVVPVQYPPDSPPEKAAG